MDARARELFAALGLRVPSVTLPVRALSGGQQQAVAIARATGFAARLVIMDEPTANLGAPAIAKVRETILRLKAQGVAVILISHRLEDVFAVADSVQVMKRGEVAGLRRVADTTADEILGMIVTGRDPARGGRGRMTPRRRRPTIIDVAQAAGVSVGTVSHVLNDTRQGAARDPGPGRGGRPAARLPSEHPRALPDCGRPRRCRGQPARPAAPDDGGLHQRRLHRTCRRAAPSRRPHHRCPNSQGGGRTGGECRRRRRGAGRRLRTRRRARDRRGRRCRQRMGAAGTRRARRARSAAAPPAAEPAVALLRDRRGEWQPHHHQRTVRARRSRSRLSRSSPTPATDRNACTSRATRRRRCARPWSGSVLSAGRRACTARACPRRCAGGTASPNSCRSSTSPSSTSPPPGPCSISAAAWRRWSPPLGEYLAGIVGRGVVVLTLDEHGAAVFDRRRADRAAGGSGHTGRGCDRRRRCLCGGLSRLLAARHRARRGGAPRRGRGQPRRHRRRCPGSPRRRCRDRGAAGPAGADGRAMTISRRRQLHDRPDPDRRALSGARRDPDRQRHAPRARGQGGRTRRWSHAAAAADVRLIAPLGRDGDGDWAAAGLAAEGLDASTLASGHGTDRPVADLRGAGRREHHRLDRARRRLGDAGTGGTAPLQVRCRATG